MDSHQSQARRSARVQGATRSASRVSKRAVRRSFYRRKPFQVLESAVDDDPPADRFQPALSKPLASKLLRIQPASLSGRGDMRVDLRIAHLAIEVLDEVLEHAEAVVIGNRSPEFDRVVEFPPAGLRVLDLVRVNDEPPAFEGYEGICW